MNGPSWLRRAWCVIWRGGHLFVGHRTSDRFAERCWLCEYVKGGWML